MELATFFDPFPQRNMHENAAAHDPLNLANVACTLHFYAGTHRQGRRNKAG